MLCDAVYMFHGAWKIAVLRDSVHMVLGISRCCVMQLHGAWKFALCLYASLMKLSSVERENLWRALAARAHLSAQGTSRVTS